ncbi:hypothetical protein Baya_10902 [Bagarius yarrelli]|uniref:Uncharacterized protein n=1 Tax=Bagarius yarrelli TaxID=175774 RepID=A0A556V0S6_BAGYA|nr:hypothetical protein Baya_10902 [Bagarius yarrelli]
MTPRHGSAEEVAPCHGSTEDVAVSSLLRGHPRFPLWLCRAPRFPLWPHLRRILQQMRKHRDDNSSRDTLMKTNVLK